MEKIKKNRDIDIPPVRLYMEDIREIEEIYRQNCKEYKIRTEDFVFDSSEELKSINEKKISNLYFESSNPSISMRLYKRYGVISGYNDEVSVLGIVTKIKSVLDKRVTPLRYIDSKWFVIFIVFLSLLSFQWALSFYRLADKVDKLFLFVSYLILSSLLLFSWMAFTLFMKHSVIYLFDKSSQKNFFSRNKDQIVLVTIGAILGALAYFLLEKLFR